MKKWLIQKLLNIVIVYLKRNNDEPMKNQILTEAVAHLFSTVTSDEILKVHGKKVSIGDRILTEPEIKQLQEEAQLLSKLKVVRVIRDEMQYRINRKLFNEAMITTDMLWGKLILYYDDVVNHCLEKIKQMKYTD